MVSFQYSWNIPFSFSNFKYPPCQVDLKWRQEQVNRWSVSNIKEISSFQLIQIFLISSTHIKKWTSSKDKTIWTGGQFVIFDKCPISNLLEYFQYLVPTLTRERLEKTRPSAQFPIFVKYPISNVFKYYQYHQEEVKWGKDRWTCAKYPISNIC